MRCGDAGTCAGGRAPGRAGCAASSLIAVTMLRVALAQLNLTVGDLDGNLATVVRRLRPGGGRRMRHRRVPRAVHDGLPAGGPGAQARLRRRQPRRRSPSWRRAPGAARRSSGSSTSTATSTTPPRCAPNGEVVGTYRKRLLPNNTVFDEARYFTPGDASDPLELYVIGGVKVGHLDLRGHLEPVRRALRAGRGRRRAEHQHQRLAVLDRQGRRS